MKHFYPIVALSAIFLVACATGVRGPLHEYHEQNNMQVCLDQGIPVWQLQGYQDGEYVNAGTVWLNEDRNLVTASHVVYGFDQEGREFTAEISGYTYPMTVIGFDPETDVAVLDTPYQINVPNGIRMTDNYAVGDVVWAAGYPGAEDVLVVYGGPVLAEAQQIPDSIKEYPEWNIPVDIAVREGMSGGPILRCNGGVTEAIGVLSTYTYFFHIPEGKTEAEVFIQSNGNATKVEQVKRLKALIQKHSNL